MYYYHVYNRGAHKINIFKSRNDMYRFLDGLVFFNTQESRGDMSKTKLSDRRNGGGLTSLVMIHAYCLLPNHYHLLISCEYAAHLSKFMQKMGTGYTGYFNEKYEEHSGTIFQGTYKKVLVESESQLHYLYSYINGNHIVHDVEENKRISSIGQYWNNSERVLGNDIFITQEFANQEEFQKHCYSFCLEIQKNRKDKSKLFLE